MGVASEERKQILVYLDNCCYNRPYDDQRQLRISLETQAKLRIQEMIRNGELLLATSVVLMYENSKSPFRASADVIRQFILENSARHIREEEIDDKVERLATNAMDKGIKLEDAYHIACSIAAGSDYFITTDDRILKYKTKAVKIVDPLGFIRETEVKYE